MNILTLETKILSAIEHAAAWLVGMCSNATVALNELEPSSTMVSQAVAIGLEAAVGHGVDVKPMENAGEAVLAAARDLQAQLMHTAGKPPVPAETTQDKPSDEPDPAGPDTTADTKPKSSKPSSKKG